MFSKNKIALADTHLAEDKGIVDILLGVNYAHILPVQSCTFGDVERPSLVYYTGVGVMLAGSAVILKANLQHVALLKKFIDTFHSAF